MGWLVKWYIYLLLIFLVNFNKCIIFLWRGIFFNSVWLVGFFLLLGNNVGNVIVVRNGVWYLFNGLLLIVGYWIGFFVNNIFFIVFIFCCFCFLIGKKLFILDDLL